MTRYVLEFALWLAPFLFAASVLMSFGGQRLSPRASPLDEPGFAACRLPCWAGITPGLTPFAEANELIAQHLPDYRVPTFLTTSSLSFQTIASEPALSGVLFYDSTRIGEIHLDAGLPVWYLMDTLGKPDCVWVSEGPSQIMLTLFWESNGRSTGGYFFFDPRSGWQSNTRTRFLQMSTVLSCDTPGMILWMGFAPAWRYAAMAGGIAVP